MFYTGLIKTWILSLITLVQGNAEALNENISGSHTSPGHVDRRK